MTYKRMYYSVSIDKRKAYYKAYYQQNKERYKQRYTKQKIKLKEHEPSDETNDHKTTLSIMSKLKFEIIYLFIWPIMITYENKN